MGLAHLFRISRSSTGLAVAFVAISCGGCLSTGRPHGASPVDPRERVNPYQVPQVEPSSIPEVTPSLSAPPAAPEFRPLEVPPAPSAKTDRPRSAPNPDRLSAFLSDPQVGGWSRNVRHVSAGVDRLPADRMPVDAPLAANVNGPTPDLTAGGAGEEDLFTGPDYTQIPNAVDTRVDSPLDTPLNSAVTERVALSAPVATAELLPAPADVVESVSDPVPVAVTVPEPGPLAVVAEPAPKVLPWPMIVPNIPEHPSQRKRLPMWNRNHETGVGAAPPAELPLIVPARPASVVFGQPELPSARKPAPMLRPTPTAEAARTASEDLDLKFE